MRKVRLRHVVAAVGGGTPRRSEASYYGGQIPWVTPKDMKSSTIAAAQITLSEVGLMNSPAKMIPAGSVLVVVRSGVLKHTLPVARAAVPLAVNQDMKALIPSPDIDGAYLGRMIKALEPTVLSWVRATTADNWPIDKLLDHEVPLPPLPEQRRIAAILDEADALRSGHRRALKLINELGARHFEAQFGTQAPNAVLGEAIESLVGGKNVVGSDDSVNPARVLKISAVTSGTYVESESKPLPDDYEPPRNHFVRPGDVLISRANTAALVGASALVSATTGSVVLPDKLWRATPRRGVDPIYLVALLQSSAIRSLISSRASGTGGAMKNISQPKLLSIPVYLPPEKVQQEFADQMTAWETVRHHFNSQNLEYDALFGSLQHRAFRGEL